MKSVVIAISYGFRSLSLEGSWCRSGGVILVFRFRLQLTLLTSFDFLKFSAALSLHVLYSCI